MSAPDLVQIGVWHDDYGFHEKEWYDARLTGNPDWDDVGYEPVYVLRTERTS